MDLPAQVNEDEMVKRAITKSPEGQPRVLEEEESEEEMLARVLALSTQRKTGDLYFTRYLYIVFEIVR